MAICNLISVILLTTIVILVQSACASSLYYPDLSKQDGNSCAEKTLFATTSDPFYDWITGSYLVTGFETGTSIKIQEAGLAYKKLSAWRVTSSNSTLFNSPEPHVVGGSFYQNPHNRIARMTVHWGLSIRICNGAIFDDKGQNMCRYTAQIMPVLLQNGSISFHSLLSEMKYIKSDLIHLTNWVSNAKTPGAVGVNRTVISRAPNFWYYSNPQLALNCSRLPIYYRADFIAYLGESYVACACVGNVCAQNFNLEVSNGEFQGAGPCKKVNSYWLPLDGGVYLYTYIPEIDRYYVLNSTFDTNKFPDNLTKDDLDGMENLSSCLEDWLASNAVQSLRTACPYQIAVWDSDLDNGTRSDMIISYGVDLALESVQKALESGDDCQETFTVEKVCSSNILTDQEVQEIKNIVWNLSLQEVRNYAHNQWANMASNRHDAYLDIVAAFLAIFVINGLVYSDGLVDIEKWLYNNCVCARGGRKGSIQSQSGFWKKVIIFSVRWIVRIGPIGAIIVRFMYSMWNTFKDLQAGPSDAWTRTVEQQPRTDIAYLVTTTSTIQVRPRWSTCYVLVGIAIVYFIPSIYLTFRTVGKHPVDDGAAKGRQPTHPVDDGSPQGYPAIP